MLICRELLSGAVIVTCVTVCSGPELTEQLKVACCPLATLRSLKTRYTSVVEEKGRKRERRNRGKNIG